MSIYKNKYKGVLLLVTLTSSLMLNGCVKTDAGVESNRDNTMSSAPGAGGGTAGDPKDEGASSGGGGYVTKNSKKILELVVGELSKEVRNASPFLFNDLPPGWTREKFADVLLNIRMHSTKDIQRDNSDLLFNYGTDENGPYIEALRPFFTVYGHIPYTFLEMYKKEKFEKNTDYESLETSLDATILDLKLKVLHEVSHHFGKDEKQAEIYSLNLLRKLERDFYICMVPRQEVTKVPNALWVSPIGKKSDSPGNSDFGLPELPGLGNYIYGNGWIYHQGKDSVFVGVSLGLSSYLDPQPFEGLRENLLKDRSIPGMLWKTQFAHRMTLTKKDGTDKNIGEFIETPAQIESSAIVSLGAPEVAPLEESHEGLPVLPPNSIFPSMDLSTIQLEPVQLKVQFESSRLLKSATVSIPAVDIIPKQTESKSTHGNPSAQVGEPNGKMVTLPLNCEYVGISP